MIHRALINPRSIAVVGGTDNLQAPGGRLLKNLLDHPFDGKIYVVNPKKKQVQGLPAVPSVQDLPAGVDLAIIAVAAKYVEDIIRHLALEKGTRGFIVISAGFGDAGPQGRELEKRIVEIVDRVGGSLLGPNNIGLINTHYAGVFTTPVPELSEQGVDLISGSGATAVFIMEAAIPLGLRFHSVWTVGNAAQIGVEDVLEHLDAQYGPGSQRTVMIYAEKINRPQKWLKHARSLREKGIDIVAIKAGSSEGGSRAASSHTGAMATPDVAVNALLAKSGILRTYGRTEMIYRAAVMQYPRPRSNKVVVVTHAGGPAVMLTDVLEKNGMQVPANTHPKAGELAREYLYPGSSVINPIDILATGTAEQLEKVLDFTLRYFDPGAVSVIFGSPGLFPVDSAYDVIRRYIQESDVPVYPIMPSVINTSREMEAFRRKGHVHFTDEVLFGRALADVWNRPPLFDLPDLRDPALRKRFLEITGDRKGYLDPETVHTLLREANLPVTEEHIVTEPHQIDRLPESFFPAVMKVVGPVHKTDVGGVRLNIPGREEAHRIFARLMEIPGARAVLVQPFLDTRLELFAGLKKEPGFGHLLMFGRGGTEIEIYRDTVTLMLPAGRDELTYHTRRLKIYPILQGHRGQEGIRISQWIDLLENCGRLAANLPEITEMDLNPVLFRNGIPLIVDARIKLG